MKIPINQYPFLFTWPAYAYLQLFSHTNRLRCEGEDYRDVLARETHAHIFSLWHSQVLIPIPYFYRHNLSVMISQSDDGEVITQAINYWNIKATRGSASKGGSQGLLGLVHSLKQGRNTIITPDGPRGPRETAQMGIIQLAKLSGVPILPVSFSCSRQIRLNSWDRFIVPLPFGVVTMKTGTRVHVPNDANKETMQTLRDQLQREMDAITSHE